MHKLRYRSARCWLLGLLLALAIQGPWAQQQRPFVYVAAIEGVIDPGLAPYVARVLETAEADGAAAVVLDINTFGGRVDAAVQIRDSLLQSRVRTIAFVNPRAISAGALISLAAQQIAMADGGTIGAATPVRMGQSGAGAEPVAEKTVSYVRKEFRSTAESRKRPLLIAEAMVDVDVAIPGVVDKGKLLTLTTQEALQHKVADFRAGSLQEVLQAAGLAGAELRTLAPNWAERVVRVLTHPVVSSILITVAMLGIIIELRTPGLGIPGALGAGSLALFLWGHWLVQLVGWEELLLAAAGVALLALELLVIPGFGIAGILGILALGAGLVLSVLGPGTTPQFVLVAAARVVFAILVAIALSLVLLRFMTRLPFGRRMILQTGLAAGAGYASAPEGDTRWLGKHGVAHSALRPAGIAEIEGERVDVVSNGELIDAGQPVEVIRVDGNRVVVRQVSKQS